MSLLRLILQVVLVVLVVFFGFHYFTRPELRSCISIPVSSLAGLRTDDSLDQEKVDEFLSQLSTQVTGVASRSGQLWQDWQAVDVGSDKISDQLLDKGQYLYCKSVVDQVERR